MGFSIDYGLGPLGWLVIIVMALAGVIAVVFLLQGARQARQEVIEEDVDHIGPEL